MQAIQSTDGTLTQWVVAFERLGPFGIQVVLLTAMVWYLRKHFAALLDSKRKQYDATSKAVPVLMTILHRIAGSLDTLLRRHGHEQADQAGSRGAPLRSGGDGDASGGGASHHDLSLSKDA